MNRRDFQELSKVRLKEAQALLAAKLWDGAYYLAGYAVECGIKSCIAKGTQRYDFPEKKKVDASYTHKLAALIGVAGLETALRDRGKKDAEFRRNWDIVESWTEESRYARHAPQDAQHMVQAIADRRYGVISWLKHY